MVGSTSTPLPLSTGRTYKSLVKEKTHWVRMHYERLTHVQHILKRPDSYIGSLAPESTTQWTRVASNFQLALCVVSPGLVKIFDEILVNAIDQYSLHPKKVNKIEIVYHEAHGTLVVKNSGVSIPIRKHDKEKDLWIPEMIFGHLLTSSNYNDDEQRVTGGRNGYGAKLTNIFSKSFCISISDGKKKYTQSWRNNMSVCEVPHIEASTSEPYVQVMFTPDYERTEGAGDFLKVIEKRVWDAAMWCSKAQVIFQSSILKVDGLEEYAKMHIGGVPLAKYTDEFCEVIVGHSKTGAFQQCSWVNGISTTKGGTHVERIVKSIVEEIGKDKRIQVKPAQIKASLFVFVKAVLVNPTFSSQTKAECTSKISDAPNFKPKFIKDILSTGVFDDLVSLGLAKVEKDLKKTDGSKRAKITGIPKLDDANWAGTHRSHECTLIVTEGDSAKALAVAGLSVVGRDKFGVFPLRGKPRNVRDVSVKQVTDNEEFSNIKKIIGLQHGKVYNSLRELRYGRLMIMTDADLDGSHIKGLILNMIHVYWPALIDLGFVVSMVTPVIKDGKTWFFTEDEYRQRGGGGGPVKYYKGLGTSTSAEAKEYFKQIDRLTVIFTSDPKLDESMTLAFSKALSDERKEWLTRHMAHPPKGVPYGHMKNISVSDFVHRDLANFSAEDIKRSIPHVADGLKPSQRKVIYAALKKNLVHDMKVAQLAGYVAEHTAYHHGEASLQGTIIHLAQNFVGANNLNLLEPNGQFGTRLAGGKDAASSRYIFTRLAPYTRRIFDPSDDEVLKYVVDDGQKVEPEFYVPVIPMILINGAEGIGTGFSCSVPPFDPEAVKHNILCALDQVPMVPMKPFFKGFKGGVTKTKDHTWVLSGVCEKEGTQLHITELPPGKWIQEFKEHLETLVEKNIIQKYENHSTETKPDFRVWGYTGDDPTKDLGLTKTIHTSNMHLIGPNGSVKKYSSPEEILVDYIDLRVDLYRKRKSHLISQLEFEIEWIRTKREFITGVVTGQIKVLNEPLEQVKSQLRKRKFDEEYVPKLLDIKTYNYTQEEVKKLIDLSEKKKRDLETLKGTSVLQMWKNNLGDL